MPTYILSYNGIQFVNTSYFSRPDLQMGFNPISYTQVRASVAHICGGEICNPRHIPANSVAVHSSKLDSGSRIWNLCSPSRDYSTKLYSSKPGCLGPLMAKMDFCRIPL